MPRLTIQFGEDTDKLLKELAAAKGTTKTEIIRRALATYKYLNDQIGNGQHNVSITSASPTSKTLKDVIIP